MRLLVFLLVLLGGGPALAQAPPVGCPPTKSGNIPYSATPQLRNLTSCGVAALTDAPTITTNASANANIFSVTLAGNRTLANPSNLLPGSTHVWLITQDSTGGRTLAYGSAFRFAAGSSGTLSTAPGVTDKLDCVAQNAATLLCTATLGYGLPPGFFPKVLADVAATSDSLAFTNSGAGGGCSFSLDFSQACNTVYAAAAVP